MSIWISSGGKVIVGTGGNPIDCPDCPCGAGPDECFCDPSPTNFELDLGGVDPKSPDTCAGGCELIDALHTLYPQGGCAWAVIYEVLDCDGTLYCVAFGLMMTETVVGLVVNVGAQSGGACPIVYVAETQYSVARDGWDCTTPLTLDRDVFLPGTLCVWPMTVTVTPV